MYELKTVNYILNIILHFMNYKTHWVRDWCPINKKVPQYNLVNKELKNNKLICVQQKNLNQKTKR